MNIGNIVGFLLGGTTVGGAFVANSILNPGLKEDGIPVKLVAFENTLNEEQIELHKFLWNNKTSKHLLDYYDYEGWIQKAKEFSVNREKWPSDIIFIEDKSNQSLGQKLRDKCYGVTKWFPQKTLDDKHEDVKKLFEGVEKNFKVDFLKELCSASTENNSEKRSSIESVNQKSLTGLIGEYVCSSTASESDSSEDMKEYYALKKEEYSSSSFCDIIKEMIVSEIKYSGGKSKYEVWKSRKVSNSFEIVPGTGTLYSSLEEIPGFLKVFEKKAK